MLQLGRQLDGNEPVTKCEDLSSHPKHLYKMLRWCHGPVSPVVGDQAEPGRSLRQTGQQVQTRLWASDSVRDSALKKGGGVGI